MMMKGSLMNFAVAAALGLALALGAATASFAQRVQDGYCIPQYDSSGAQIAPYC
jgi:hypothetical protein